MLNITNTKVYGLSTAKSYAKLPMMDFTNLETLLEETEKGVFTESTESRNNRMKRLGSVPIGTGHDNVLQGIIVQFTVDFTIKAWTEAQRYHFIDFISSSSSIHMLSKVDLDKAYIEYVDPRMIEVMKELVEEYNKDKTQENFYKMIYSNPCGMKLTAAMTTNYRQLKTIYEQRHNHKLQEWRDFCDWILTLPYFKEWVLGETK